MCCGTSSKVSVVIVRKDYAGHKVDKELEIKKPPPFNLSQSVSHCLLFQVFTKHVCFPKKLFSPLLG